MPNYSGVPELVRTARDRAGLRNAEIAAKMRQFGSRAGAEFDAEDLARELTRDLPPKRAQRLVDATMDALLADFEHEVDLDTIAETAERAAGRLKVAAWLEEQTQAEGADIFDAIAAELIRSVRAAGAIRISDVRVPKLRRAASELLRQMFSAEGEALLDEIRSAKRRH